MLLEDPSHLLLMPHVIISQAVPEYSWGTRSFQSHYWSAGRWVELRTANILWGIRHFMKKRFSLFSESWPSWPRPFLFTWNLFVRKHTVLRMRRKLYTVVYFHKTAFFFPIKFQIWFFFPNLQDKVLNRLLDRGGSIILKSERLSFEVQ